MTSSKWSRISQGRIELRKESIDLAQAVDDAVAACRPVFVELGHRLTVSLPPSRCRLRPTRPDSRRCW